MEKITTKCRITESDVSDVFDALSFLLRALDAPKNVQLLLPAILGMMSGRQTTVKFHHGDIGRRMFSPGAYLPAGDYQQWRERIEARVSRAIDQLLTWRDLWGLPIIYTPGGKIEGQIIPSKIQTPLLSWCAEIVQAVRGGGLELDQDAGEEPDYQRARRFRDAVKELLARKRIKRKDRPPQRERREQSETQISRTIHTLTCKLIAKRLENRGEEVGTLINSYIWDLTGKLEAEFCGKGDNFDPLHDPHEAGGGNEEKEEDFSTDEGLVAILPAQKNDPYLDSIVDHNFSTAEESGTQGGQAFAPESDHQAEPGRAIQSNFPGGSPDEPLEPAGPVSGDHYHQQTAGDALENTANFRNDPAPCAPDSIQFPALLSEIEGLPGDQWRAFAACLSVNATPAEWLYKDDKRIDKDRQAGGGQIDPRTLANELSGLLGNAKTRERSFIVRLEGPVILRDDCDMAAVERLRPFAFLITETSRGNYQAWLSVANCPDIEETRRAFHRALDLAGIAGNRGSTTSLRWPGSVNFKPGRGQWRIRIDQVRPGRVVAVEELTAAGLLAGEEMAVKREPLHQALAAGFPARWPDYSMCIDRAPLVQDGKRVGLPDRSAADFRFAYIALLRGFDQAAIAQQIEEISDKAKEKRGGSRAAYARQTVSNAARELSVSAT